ncbi:hypothetical protein [Nonomuraea sp. NPDC050786]|uniref:hypothetical protein n=1 Tax=Nonomuraea sp. NPDC050786 TaxID=3154840 RepID=UPI0033F8E919
MFARLDGSKVEWIDGRRGLVEVVLLATGYRPILDYLAPLGALTSNGRTIRRAGSRARRGLGNLGLE